MIYTYVTQQLEGSLSTLKFGPRQYKNLQAEIHDILSLNRMLI